MPEQLAESSVTFDLANSSRRIATHDRSIPNPLVRSFMVVVLDILADQVVKMLPANRDEVIKALNFERFDPSLDMRIQKRCFDRQRVWFHTFSHQCFVELSRVKHIVVSHKNSGELQSKLLHHHWETFSGPAHPLTCWMFRSFGNDDSSALDVHEYKCGVSLEPSWSEYFLVEEVARPEC